MVNNYIVLYYIEQNVLIQRNVSTQEDDYSTLVYLIYYFLSWREMDLIQRRDSD